MGKTAACRSLTLLIFFPLLAKMVKVYIGIGSNLGNRQENIKKAIQQIKNLEKTEIAGISSLIQTKPQEATGPDYLNAVLKIKTELQPYRLLECLQEIENNLGRKRSFKNCPRTIDLDILFYGNEKIKTKKLTVPHPKIGEREFVKKPLFELEPEFKRIYRKK